MHAYALASPLFLNAEDLPLRLALRYNVVYRRQHTGIRRRRCGCSRDEVLCCCTVSIGEIRSVSLYLAV